MKQIEKLANDFTRAMTSERVYGSAEKWKQDCDYYRQASMAVLPWLFGRPLSERLTDDEKGFIIKLYSETFPHDVDGSVSNIRVRCTLRDIFGADFFEEGYV